MNKTTLLLLAVLSFLLSCAPDSNTSQSSSMVSDSPAANDTAPPKEIAHVPASVLAPMVGMWHYQTVMGLSDAKAGDAYQGRWIDLKGDQTFTSGIWQEQTNSGKWTFDGETKLINFYYAQPETIFDEFAVQGVGGDIVIFKGNTERTKRGIQIKMVKSNDRPVL